VTEAAATPGIQSIKNYHHDLCLGSGPGGR
jgi:hypothetical protein